MGQRFLIIMLGYGVAVACMGVGYVIARAGVEAGTALLVAFGVACISYVALEVAIALVARVR